MAKDVPFHATFTSGFMKESEAEARTAICTKIGLEQLTSTPNFTAKLWSIRVRKFIADTFFPAVENEDDEVSSDFKKSNLGVYKVASFLLLVSVLFLARSQPPSAVWVKNVLLSRVGRSTFEAAIKESVSVNDRQALQPAPPVPAVPGWCHLPKLWHEAPHCGQEAGNWDSAARHLAVAAASATDAFPEARMQDWAAKMEDIEHSLYQQAESNSYLYHDIKNDVNDIKSIVSDFDARLQKTARKPDAVHANLHAETPLPSPAAVTGSSVMPAAAMVLCMLIVVGLSAKQNARHQADMSKILQQCQRLQEQVACLSAIPEKMSDLESQVKRQNKLANEARADNHQLHEDLREKLDVSVQDMNMTQSQLAGLLASLSSDVRFLKSEAHADMSRFREAIEQLEAEREVLHSEIDARDQQILEEQKQFNECFLQLQHTNKLLQDTEQKLQAREQGMSDMTALMHDLQEELQQVDEALQAKAEREQELLEHLEVETKQRIANEGYVDILRNQHDILTKAVVSMNEYLEADETMRVALEGRVADLEAERDNLISQLSQSREAEQQALYNADKYRKEVTEKEKLLHYRKYEMEMLMKMAKENNSARSAASMASH